MNPEQTPQQDNDANQEPVATPEPAAFAPEQPIQEEAPAPVVSATTVAAAPAAENPGKTMGIIAFVWSILGGTVLSLVLAIVALVKSKHAGHSNGMAVAAIVISALGILAIPFWFAVFITAYANISEAATTAGLIPLALF